MKKTGLILTAIFLAAGAWQIRSMVSQPETYTVDEMQNLEKVKNLPLGITRPELLTQLGKPLENYDSLDGRYELLHFPTPPTTPDMIAAVVEKQSGKVVAYKPGSADIRSAEGFHLSNIQWDYSRSS